MNENNPERPPVTVFQHSRLISEYTGCQWLASEPDDNITEIAWCLDCGAQIDAAPVTQPEIILDPVF